jgi:hypothetical protein
MRLKCSALFSVEILHLNKKPLNPIKETSATNFVLYVPLYKGTGVKDAGNQNASRL